MSVAVYVPLLLPLLAVPLARLVSARVDPRRATWLLTTSAVVLAATSCGALGLLALAAVVRVPSVARLGHLSVSVVGRNDLVGAEVAVAAGIAFALAVVSVTRFVIGHGSALHGAFGLARRLPGAGDVVVTPDADADAYALPGRPGRVVVSRGMLDAVGPTGRGALVAHERAHLAGRHYLFTSAVRLAATANPLLRPLVGAVEYTVERWADERAASAVGDRRLVAATIARAARAATASRSERAVSLVLGIAASSAAPGPVPRRVAALLSAPPRLRWALIAVGASVIGLATVCAVVAANDLQDLVSLARDRPA